MALRRIPAVLTLPQCATITYVRCVIGADGKHDASTAKFGFAMTRAIRPSMRGRVPTRTDYVEEKNVFHETSK